MGKSRCLSEIAGPLPLRTLSFLRGSSGGRESSPRKGSGHARGPVERGLSGSASPGLRAASGQRARPGPAPQCWPAPAAERTFSASPEETLVERSPARGPQAADGATEPRRAVGKGLNQVLLKSLSHLKNPRCHWNYSTNSARLRGATSTQEIGCAASRHQPRAPDKEMDKHTHVQSHHSEQSAEGQTRPRR